MPGSEIAGSRGGRAGKRAPSGGNDEGSEETRNEPLLSCGPERLLLPFCCLNGEGSDLYHM